MSNPKGIGQALGHFVMAFGHMAFSPKEQESGDDDFEGEANEADQPPAGSCCIKRSKGSKVRSVRKTNPTR